MTKGKKKNSCKISLLVIRNNVAAIGVEGGSNRGLRAADAAEQEAAVTAVIGVGSMATDVRQWSLLVEGGVGGCGWVAVGRPVVGWSGHSLG